MKGYAIKILVLQVFNVERSFMSATMQPSEIRDFQIPSTGQPDNQVVAENEQDSKVQGAELVGVDQNTQQRLVKKSLFSDFESAMPWLDHYDSLDNFGYAAAPIDMTRPGVFNFIVELGSDPESVAGYSLRNKPAYKRAEDIALRRGWPTPEDVSEKLKSYGFDGDKVQFDDLPREIQEEVHDIFQLMTYCTDIKDPHVLNSRGRVNTNYISG